LPPAPPLTEQPAATGATPKSARRKARSFFWPGFAFGFLLLASLTCGLSAAALGLNRLSLDDFRGANGAVWTPMPITPTPAVAQAGPAAEGSPATRPGGSTAFAAGQTARNLTNSRVNIRMTPGYLGKAASDVIGQVAPGETLQILGDPTVADELTWWRVQATSGGQSIVGWIAEATSSGVQILGAAQ
jgi:hypothetical protein